VLLPVYGLVKLNMQQGWHQKVQTLVASYPPPSAQRKIIFSTVVYQNIYPEYLELCLDSELNSKILEINASFFII
jgi:hypothetical protein